MKFSDSVLINYSGDSVQVGRLEQLLHTVKPQPNLCDKIGIVTCTSTKNNRHCWLVDGTHQSGCIHLALGNNSRHGEIIHSTAHIDFDMHRPMLIIDGVTIYENGIFQDDLIFS